MVNIKKFIKENTVLTVAAMAAAVSCVFITPDAKYTSYFDLKTLTCLFCVLSVVCAMRNIELFSILARKVVAVFKSARMSVLGLVFITFIGSMLIANDMALITFLPLGYYILEKTGKRELMAFTFIMQNIAANLGGMLTPFGNPQNLFLYSKFNIPDSEFVSIMAFPFAISIAAITVCCLFIAPEKIDIPDEGKRLPPLRTVVYILLFVLSIAIVFRAIPYYIGPAVIFPALFLMDRKALSDVDYTLLLTFVCFFIFAGNVSRIEPIRLFFMDIMKKSTLLTSVLSCQLISNVPTAILLSGFTDNYRELLRGVNIGGVGTLISSMASLITFREYIKHNPDKAKEYIIKFSVFNFAFLIILTVSCYFLG
ncbi:MAG: SLC13 family permease [Oscillospiraceae bacterium]|nr:SLC13 family permease [Oscillospiraceae bacterium]